MFCPYWVGETNLGGLRMVRMLERGTQCVATLDLPLCACVLDVRRTIA